MPKITTEIRNVAAKLGNPTPPAPARRALEKFKRNVQKLPFRLAHALNFNSKVAPLNKGNRQAYLSKLSQDKMDPLDTFKGLIFLSESEKPRSFNVNNFDEKQIYRMLENFKSHGETIGVLDKQIRDMNASETLNDHENNLLQFLKRSESQSQIYTPLYPAQLRSTPLNHTYFYAETPTGTLEYALIWLLNGS